MTISEGMRRVTVGLVRPPKRLRVSEWADAEARIPEEGNAEPGRYRLSRMPHQVEMLDDPLDPTVREIFWMMASQAAGKTLCVILIAEYIIRVLRKSLLMVRATKDTAAEWMRDKFIPTVEATPCMRGVLKDPREKGSGSTALKRRFPGGSMKVAGAKSPATLRGSSQGKIIQDEIDSYEVTKEGDPCALADRAAITFSDAWKIKCSTPTLKGFSRVDAGFERGDQRYYFLPCVCCGEFQALETERMKFSFTAAEYERFNKSPTAHSQQPEKLQTESDTLKGGHRTAAGESDTDGAADGEGAAGGPSRTGDVDLPGEQATEEVANGFTWEIGDFEIKDTKRCIYVCAHCHRGWTDQQRLQAYWSGHRDNPAVFPKFGDRAGLATARGEEEGKKAPAGEKENAGALQTLSRGSALQTDKSQTGTEEVMREKERIMHMEGELRAHWRATAPFRGIRSRHLNGMYLSIGLKKGMVNYLHQFAEDFLEAARGGREKLMVWTNIFKTVAYEDPHQKMDWRDLQARAEDYWAGYDAEGKSELPVEVMWIAGGADIQADRVEILLWGWGDGEEAWALEHHVEFGDFDMPRTQERVAAWLLGKRFKHPVLGELAISAMAIDSGHQTKVKAVYQFCAKHALQNWWSVKGFDNALGAAYQTEKEKVYGGRRFNLNVDLFKTTVFGRLMNREPGPRYVHFPKRFEAKFYAQLCSEKRITIKFADGSFQLKWVKLVSGARNEILDMTVYAFGIFDVCRQQDAIARLWKTVREKIGKDFPEAKGGLGPVRPDGSRDYVLEGKGEEREEKNAEVELEGNGGGGSKERKPWSPKPGVTGGKRRVRVNSPFRKY